MAKKYGGRVSCYLPSSYTSGQRVPMSPDFIEILWTDFSAWEANYIFHVSKMARPIFLTAYLVYWPGQSTKTGRQANRSTHIIHRVHTSTYTRLVDNPHPCIFAHTRRSLLVDVEKNPRIGWKINGWGGPIAWKEGTRGRNKRLGALEYVARYLWIDPWMGPHPRMGRLHELRATDDSTSK